MTPRANSSTAWSSRVHDGDPQIERDLERLGAVKRKRQERAASYFSAQRRELGRDPRAACDRRLGRGGDPQDRRQAAVPVDARPRHRHRPAARAVRAALPARRRHRHVARDADRRPRQSRRAGVNNAQVRQGDIYAPPVERDAFDLVTIHQVLHYLDDPQAAIREAARTLRPGRPAADRRLRLARAGVPARRACACAARLLRRPDRRMVRRGRARPRGDASSSSRAPAPTRR